jgi:hypothetical protein
MFTALVIKNLYTSEQVDLYDVGYEVNYFDWHQIFAGDDVKRGQSFGRWHNYKLVEYMAIDIRGAVLDNDVTTFWASVNALAKAVIPDPASNLRDHVSITVTADDGSGTQYIAYCIVDTISMPRNALAPAVAQFEFGFDCRDGYWTNISTGAYARLL